MAIPMLHDQDIRTQLRVRLGRLASVEFQRLLCVKGTPAAYVLPNEVMDSAVNAVQRIVDSPSLMEKFTPSERDALREFLSVVQSEALRVPFESESVSPEALVERDPAWTQMRASAQQCMKALGLEISLAELLERS